MYVLKLGTYPACMLVRDVLSTNGRAGQDYVVNLFLSGGGGLSLVRNAGQILKRSVGTYPAAGGVTGVWLCACML